MPSNIRIGSIRGIPVGLNASWFLIFGLVTWSLAEGYLPPAYPGLPATVYWLLAAVTSLLFFSSVLLHELGHSLTALRHGIPVRGITLFIFGGVAQIGREPDRPGVEFRIAIAGPAASLGLAVIFAGLFLLDRSIPYLAAPSFWLMRINFMLAAFNLIPGFPLDGGRVLRAAIWRFTGSYQRATRAAAFTGQLVAFGFMGLGVLTMFGGAFFNGLWLVFIGWFLHSAATASSAQVGVQTLLSDVTAGQAMSTDCGLVPPDLTIGRIVEEQVLTRGRRCFFVAQPDGLLAGMITLREIGRVPQEQWPWLPVSRAMIPLDALVVVPPETPLLTALRLMDDANVAQLPVVDASGRILGLLSREQVLHEVRARAEPGR